MKINLSLTKKVGWKNYFYGKFRIKCPNCKYEGNGKRDTAGSCCLELALWLIFFPAGAVYSAWRMGSYQIICPECEYEKVTLSGDQGGPFKEIKKPKIIVKKANES